MDEPQTFSVSIYTVTGAVVMQQNEASANKYSASFSISNLAAGNYFIKIQGEKGQVVKQLVIAH